MSSEKRYIGIKLLWSNDYRLWSWFTWHGVESAYTGGRYESTTDGKLRMIRAPDRVFNRIYHLGPLKIFLGVI